MKIQPAINYNPQNSTGEEWIDCAVQNGFKCMEIAVSQLPYEEEKQNEIIEYAKAKGLLLSLHSPYGKNNITDTDEENRVKSIAQVKYSIDLAAKHKLTVVTFHPGRLSDENESLEEKWEMLLEVVSDIAEYAKVKKVRIGIENMEQRKNEIVYTIDDLNRFAEIGKDNPYFGVTIDFAHFSSHNIIKPDLSRLKLPVYNVHLSQGFGGKMHFPLTVENGMVDLQSVCKVLYEYEYSSFVVLETRGEQAQSKKILEAATEAFK